jgi:amino acid transporter
VNASYFFALTLPEMAGSELVAADAATRVVGQTGRALVSALVMLSTFGALNGVMMTGPRVFWAMADDGLFFRPIAAVHRRFGTPHVAIAFASVLGIAFVSLRSFEQLAGAFVLGIWPFYALAVSAVFVQRRRAPAAPRPYRTWGYPITPALFLIASLLMLANSFVQEPWATGAGLLMILAGIPVWWIRRHLGARTEAQEMVS